MWEGFGNLGRYVLCKGLLPPVKTCDQDIVLLGIGRNKIACLVVLCCSICGRLITVSGFRLGSEQFNTSPEDSSHQLELPYRKKATKLSYTLLRKSVHTGHSKDWGQMWLASLH